MQPRLGIIDWINPEKNYLGKIRDAVTGKTYDYRSTQCRIVFMGHTGKPEYGGKKRGLDKTWQQKGDEVMYVTDDDEELVRVFAFRQKWDRVQAAADQLVRKGK